MSPRGLLLVVAVLALFLAIFVPLARRINGGRDAAIDADRLRHTYVALSLYESEHEGSPPPSLCLVQRDVETIDLQSVDDPNVHEGGHEGDKRAKVDSCDGAPLEVLPRTGKNGGWDSMSWSRISWSYRYHWPESRQVQGYDRRQGILADWWTGPIMTVTMDGAIVTHPSGRLDFKTLFGR